MPQQSYLSNYDPSAFESGIQWAAQRQSARDSLVKQAQENEAQKARVEQEGEIQRRNQAAQQAAEWAHEAQVTAAQKNDPAQWAESRKQQMLTNLDAQWRTNLTAMEGAGNRADYEAQNKEIIDKQNRLAGVNTNEPIDWTPYQAPASLSRVPGQDEVDAAKAALQKGQLDEDYKHAQIRNINSEIGRRGVQNRTDALKEARRQMNPATKLAPEKRLKLKLMSESLGAYNTALSVTPKQAGGLVIDFPNPEDFKDEDGNPRTGVDPDRSKKARDAFFARSGAIMQGLNDPDVAAAYGINEDTRRDLIELAPAYGGYTKPSQIHSITSHFAAEAQRHVGSSDYKKYYDAYQQVSGAFQSRSYVDPDAESTGYTGGRE